MDRAATTAIWVGVGGVIVCLGVLNAGPTVWLVTALALLGYGIGYVFGLWRIR